MPQSIMEVVQVPYPWNKTEDTPPFTEFPPHILILSELEEYKKEVMCLQNNVKDDMKDLMEEQSFSSQASTRQSIIDVMIKNNKEILYDIITGKNLSLSIVTQ